MPVREVAKDVDLEVLAGRTVRFSGADIRNLVNEAALLAGRERKAQALLNEHRQRLDALAEALLKDETVERAGIMRIFETGGESGGRDAELARAG
jgi:cell division protease FtsH